MRSWCTVIVGNIVSRLCYEPAEMLPEMLNFSTELDHVQPMTSLQLTFVECGAYRCFLVLPSILSEIFMIDEIAFRENRTCIHDSVFRGLDFAVITMVQWSTGLDRENCFQSEQS